MQQDSQERRQNLARTATEYFQKNFGERPEATAIAPGRVNLIGEHTDYNDGFVLPMAIDFHMAVAFRPRNDKKVNAYAIDISESGSFSLEDRKLPKQEWLRYVASTAYVLMDDDFPIDGMDIVIHSNVPIGAGLSSSAALEMGVARAFSEGFGLEWIPNEMALRGQRAENHYVGVQCGIMDQYAVACSREHHALLLDCRSIESDLVPVPEKYAVVVMDSGVRRTLSSSAYNERRSQCQTAVAALAQIHPHVTSLRDATPEMLDDLRLELDPVVFRRARFVIEEIERPPAFRDFILDDDSLSAGSLMYMSHAGLRDAYDVSCPELDLLVELSGKADGCYGARLTGAGFGGCAIALVDRLRAESFIHEVQSRYEKATGRSTPFYLCHASRGASIWDE